jgi:hypothetical protein
VEKDFHNEARIFICFFLFIDKFLMGTKHWRVKLPVPWCWVGLSGFFTTVFLEASFI